MVKDKYASSLAELKSELYDYMLESLPNKIKEAKDSTNDILLVHDFEQIARREIQLGAATWSFEGPSKQAATFLARGQEKFRLFFAFIEQGVWIPNQFFDENLGRIDEVFIHFALALLSDSDCRWYADVIIKQYEARSPLSECEDELQALILELAKAVHATSWPEPNALSSALGLYEPLFRANTTDSDFNSAIKKACDFHLKKYYETFTWKDGAYMGIFRFPLIGQIPLELLACIKLREQFLRKTTIDSKLWLIHRYWELPKLGAAAPEEGEEVHQSLLLKFEQFHKSYFSNSSDRGERNGPI